MRRLPIIFDVDAGVDDTLALVYALLNPSFDVRAITAVAGNVDVGKVTRNIALTLDILQPWLHTVPMIGRGASRPLRHPLFTAADVHGDDGVGGASRFYPAAAGHLSSLPAHRLISRILRSVRDVTICATGPLTNLALLLKHDRSAFRRVKEIVVTGGGFDGERNTGPVAEFNFFVDPVAADLVLSSGVPIRLVPLNVTHQCVLHASDLASLPPGPVRTYLLRVTRRYFAFHRRVSGFDGGYMHDALAAAAASAPNILTYQRGHVVVEPTDTYTRGMSLFLSARRRKREATPPAWVERVLERSSNVSVAVEVRPSAFRREFLSVIRNATA